MDELGEAVVVLHRHLDDGVIDLLFHIDRVGVDYGALLVEAADEAGNAALEVVGYLVVGPEVFVSAPVAAECDFQALVEICHFLEALAQHIEVVGEVLEYLDVGHERDGGAGLAAAAPRQRLGCQLGLAAPAREGLPVQRPVSADLDFEALGERVDDRCANAVQSAGYGVSLAAELAAGVQGGHDSLHGGHSGGGVDIDGDAAPVVLYANHAVGQDVDGYAGGEACHELVHAVIDNLIDQMVQAALVGASDVHAGALSHGFHAFEHLNIIGGVHVNFSSRRHIFTPEG